MSRNLRSELLTAIFVVTGILIAIGIIIAFSSIPDASTMDLTPLTDNTIADTISTPSTIVTAQRLSVTATNTFGLTPSPSPMLTNTSTHTPIPPTVMPSFTDTPTPTSTITVTSTATHTSTPRSMSTALPTTLTTPPTRTPFPSSTSTTISPTTSVVASPTPVAPVSLPTPIATHPVLVAEGCLNPSVQITSPRPNERLSEPFEVVGTATLPNFGLYRVEIRPDSALVYQRISAVQQVVFADVLARIDPADYPTGVYWIRLVVLDNRGTIVENGTCAIPTIFE